MSVGHADIRTKAEDEAYQKLHESYIKNGRSISFADCTEMILRHIDATDDFEDITKLIDPETNSNRLVDHLQLKATNTIKTLCEYKIVSLTLAVLLLILIIGFSICICVSVCCRN